MEGYHQTDNVSNATVQNLMKRAGHIPPVPSRACSLKLLSLVAPLLKNTRVESQHQHAVCLSGPRKLGVEGMCEVMVMGDRARCQEFSQMTADEVLNRG